MALPVLYGKDVNQAVLNDKTVAVLGYGNQGHAHALNLRDAGVTVIVGQRAGKNADRAKADGFEVLSLADATRQADLVILSLPDELMGDIFAEQVGLHLKKGAALGFVHGFAVRFGLIPCPADVDVVLVAPKGPGALLRARKESGGGLTCLVAVEQDATGQAREIALAWASAIGGDVGGMMKTTFADECESDLFGEQTVLCGGVIELMKAGFDVLVEAGIPPELAYFEAVHEVKQVVDLQYAEGLAAMRAKISNTASYGGLTRGPRLIDEGVKARMREMLAEIRDGRFAQEWVADARAGLKTLRELEAQEADSPTAKAGERVIEVTKKAAG